LAIFLQKIIKKGISNPNSFIKNHDLFKKIKNVELETNIQLASFDGIIIHQYSYGSRYKKYQKEME
jgi:hypothetical protein